jgi:hypothetical protein
MRRLLIGSVAALLLVGAFAASADVQGTLASTQERVCDPVYVDPHHAPSPRGVDESVVLDGVSHPFTVLLPSD